MSAAAVVLIAAGVGIRAQSAREQTLFVSALDASGEPVLDLSANEIVVLENGARREVLRLTPATEPMDIALLVDNSAAVDGDLVPLRRALTAFVDAMSREHRIAIFGLAARPTIFAEYTGDVERLHAAIGLLFPDSQSGMTLLDALVEVSRGLERRDATRAALIAVITDGQELGHEDDRSALDALRRAGASLHAVGVGQFTGTGGDTMRYRDLALAQGTRDTGGRFDTLLNSLGWPRALEQLARELSSQYKVVYGRPESLIPPDPAEVSSTRPGVAVRATPARASRGAR